MSKQQTSMQQQIWFIYVNQQTRGPMGLRDIDVLLRTNEINPRTFCWKNGMKQWKPMIQIEEIKNSIIDSSNQLLEIEKKNNSIEQKSGQPQNKPQDPDAEPQQQDHMIENQDENPMTILEVTVENLLKKSFLQSQDGKWSIYDEQKGQWIVSDTEPTEKIAQMKNTLMSKLKSQFFADEKNKRKYKPQNKQEHKQILTKEQLEKREKNKKKAKRAAEKRKEKWYQPKINTFVYVSGLPLDVTQDELKEFASKAGVLRIDLTTGKEKVKIYKDQYGLPKGDAVVSYARDQSVDIALQMLNMNQIRPGFKVKVQKAQFNQKDQEYKKRESKKDNKIKKILAKKNEEKQLAWDDDIQQKGDGFRIVIIKYLFTLSQSENEAEMAQIKSEVTAQIGKIGEIKRIRFFENHPDGVVEVKFALDKDAQKCIQQLNGRFFDGRQLVCEYWDGETDYKLDAHSIQLQQQRLLKFGNQLQTIPQSQQKQISPSEKQSNSNANETEIRNEAMEIVNACLKKMQ